MMAIEEQYKGFKQRLIDSEIQKLINGELELLILVSQEELVKRLYSTLEKVYDIGYQEGCYVVKQQDLGY